MESSKEMAMRELLFHAECELQSMIAENKERERKGYALAYPERAFRALGEKTRDAYLGIVHS